MNVDTDTQYAFTRPVADHMFKNYDGVLKIDGEVGSKKVYDPRSWGKAGEAGMAARVTHACEDLLSAGHSSATRLSQGTRMERQNLLGEPPATYLLPNEEADAALAAGEAPEKVAARFPDYSAAWAALAERAYAQGNAVTAYAYARTGYHRGLDQLRRAGWKGHGPVPWEHEPNRGFLRSLHLLGTSAAAIGEDDEAERCAQFLRDSSATAAACCAAR